MVDKRFSKPHVIDKNKLIKAAEAATDKLEMNAKKFGMGFPATCSQNHKYVLGANNNWECGMYTGCFWLAYEITGNKFFREIAEKHLETYRQRFEQRIAVDDHDVGFVVVPSCVAAYKVTGNEEAAKMALDMAKYYYEKSYSEKGKFIIRAHRGWDTGWGCRTMMDSLMNAPYLFWAANQTDNDDYFRAAYNQNRTTAKYLIREDGSSFHHYQFDPLTAEPVKGLTFQGHADDSCWSRGHSWGVYGFPIAYSYTKDKSFIDVHKAVTYFMLNHLPEDLIPYWDYDFTSGNEQPRDSSAGVISVCGMHEMCRHLTEDDEQKSIFESASSQILEAVIDHCTGDIGVEYDGLICHVTHAVPQKQGFDECAVYGDYFYLEALLRYLKPDWEKYW